MDNHPINHDEENFGRQTLRQKMMAESTSGNFDSVLPLRLFTTIILTFLSTQQSVTANHRDPIIHKEQAPS